MAVVSVEITERAPFAGGAESGRAGPYERVDGLLTHAVDPANPANALITDLALAPRGADGLVRFTGDFTLIAPVDRERGNGELLIDVVNRGRRQVMPTFNLAPPSRVGSSEVPLGDGFLCRRGYTVLSVGWQWDVPRSPAMMGLEAPAAFENGKPATGQVLVEIRPDAPQRTRLLANRVHKPYPAADVDEPQARLLVKDWEDGSYREIPRSAWRFAEETDAGVIPSTSHITVEAGMEPGKIYHVVYTTDHAPMVGAGLLAVRDAAAWLKHGGSELAPSGFAYAHAYGVSQTGRLLRHLLYLGLNVDEEGRQVYDGLLVHVAGARRGEFNQRFGQPSVQSTPGFGHLFPFADNELSDPFTEERDGLLRRVRAAGAAPRVVYTNTSAEYWRGDGSLTHIDPTGRHDLDEAPESRTYLFAGTQHTMTDSLPAPGDPNVDGTERRFPGNALDYRPLLRAALANLSAWARGDAQPPPSRHPRLDNGDAVTRAEALASLRAVDDEAKPDPERLWRLREADMGPRASEGVGAYPVAEGRAYPSFVSALDADGNEVAGIRLPDIEAPVGTHSGWNPRHPDSGSPEQIIPMVGFSLFFSPDEVRRRYADRAAYEAQARAAAERLAAERYLLAEDVEVVVAGALSRYDDALAGNPGAE